MSAGRRFGFIGILHFSLTAASFLLGAPKLAAAATPALTVTPATLASGTVNAPYSASLNATGGTPPYSNWVLSTGTLPAGITLSTAGVLSGTPTKTGLSTFKVKVTDSANASATSASLTLTITAALAISTSTTLTAGKVNAAYSLTLAATGGTPPYSGWTISGGTAPPGLTLSSAGVLSGTPTAAAAYSFTVGVSDKAGASATASFQLTIAPGKLAITTTSTLPAGNANLGYAESLVASGGTPPYTSWATTTGTLPPGIILSSAGTLSGVPTAQGAYTFTVQVTDSASTTASTPFSLTINPPVLAVATNSPLPSGQVNALYSQTLTATGGTPPYANWTTASGSTLPPGLTLTSAGVLAGTPSSSGVYSFMVQVSDHAGGSASASLQLSIVPGVLAMTSTSPLTSGKVGVNYSQTLIATGGRPPYTWATNSSVPGVSFSTGGVWSGIPSAAGTFSFTIQVADSAGANASAGFQITISPSTPVTISTTSPLPSGSVNSSYLQYMAAAYGTPPYVNWTVISGALPQGLSLSSSGAVSGTPAAAGTSSFTIQVTDNGGVNASAPFQLTINAAKLSVSTPSPLPSGKVNSNYSFSMVAGGGTPPYTWISNNTTPGLTFSSAGVLSGTPTTAGTYNFSVQVTDSVAATATAQLQLTVNPPALAIVTTSPLPAGQIGTMYSQVLTASGGTPPYNWSTTSTTPTGLGLNSAGLINGMPGSIGTFNFTVQVSDKSGANVSAPFQLTVNPAALVITTSSPPTSGRVNTNYSLLLAANGGTPPYANWTIASGALPPGLTLSAAGLLGGTPVSAGTYSFTIRLTDNAGSSATAFLQLTINPAALVITTASLLPAGKVNTSYFQSLAATGGTPPYMSWTIQTGALPPGLTLNSAGTLTGTPATAGNYSFTAQVTDSANATGSAPFQLTINPGPLGITTLSPLTAGRVNVVYSQSLAASGGTPPYANWTTPSGTLPPGLTLTQAGVLGGTPTSAGAYNFTIQIVDKAGAIAAAPFQLTIANSAPSITTASPLPAGKVNASYSLSLTAGGGTPPYSNWTTANGTPPPGLVLSSSGVWSGVPTAAGTYSFTVQVTDSSGASGSGAFQLTINPAALVITTTSPLPAGNMNAPYSLSLTAAGGTPPYSNWTTASGTPPPGLALSSSGVWSGTPTAAGAYNFTVQLTDSAGASASGAFQLTINPAALVITTTSPLPAGNMNAPYSLTLTAGGGTPPYSNWTTASGTLPPGLALSSSGVWSGAPTAAGAYNFTVQVTDSAGVTAAVQFQLTVSPPAPNVVAAVSSAGFVGGLPVTTGSWVALYGTNLAPAGDSRTWNSTSEIVNGQLPVSLDGTSVTVDGKAATVEYISPGQVNIQMPDDTTIGPVSILLTTSAGGASTSFTVNYAQFSPGFFPASAPYIVAQHADNSYVTPSSPALPGEVIILWGGGMGPANPAVPAGHVFTGANPLANIPTLTIGGQPAALDFAGIVGAGLVQINAHVPAGLGSGDQAVVATVGGVSSSSGAYISVGTPSAPASQLRSSTPLSANLQSPVDLAQTSPPALLSPSPIYAGTDNGIYKSSDGGASWQQSLPSPGTHSAIRSILVDPFHPARIYAAGRKGSDGGIFFTSLDAGETWSGEAVPAAASLAMDATATNVIYLLAASGGTIYVSADSGQTWSPSPVTHSVAIAADPNITGVIYASMSTEQFQLLKSYDFGATWSPVTTDPNPLTSRGFTGGIAALSVDPYNSSTLYAATYPAGCHRASAVVPSRLHRTTDGGLTWQDFAFEASSFSVQPPAPFISYVAENSSGLSATAFGTLFTDPALNGNLLYLLPALSPDCAGSNGILRSSNKGATWNFSPVLPDSGRVFSLGISSK